MALLHQCGLHVPAERARLPVFSDVLADIGDEQSITASLSTFSGHLRNLVQILGAATPSTLVLLDEVAAGTDPIEGAALARALLDELSQRAALTDHDDALRRGQAVGERDAGRAQRRCRVRRRDAGADLHAHARAPRAIARARDRARGSGWTRP